MTTTQWVLAWVLYLILVLWLAHGVTTTWSAGGIISDTNWFGFWTLTLWLVGIGALVTWVWS